MSVLTEADRGAKPSELAIVPFDRNPSFVCRDDVLKTIEEALCPQDIPAGSDTRSCVLHGIGGMGKTQTALEYIYRYPRTDRYVFWLKAETTAELCETFGQIAQVLHLSKDSEVQDHTQLEMVVKRWLSEGKSCELLSMIR